MKLRACLPLLALALASTSALAQSGAGQPTRIAVIDVQKVLTQSIAGRAAYEKLKRIQDSQVAKARRLDEEIRQIDADLSARRTSLSEARLAELQKQLADKRSEMQRYAQNAERELGELRDRELQALKQKIKPVIDALGAELNLAAVFNKFESGLVYASDRIDLSDEVIKRFNALK